MGLEKHTRRQWRPTKLEQSIEKMARRRATKQLLHVPWDRFRETCARYPRWLGFTLWTKAILAAEGHTPSWLIAELKTHFPDFSDNEALTVGSGLLDLRLREWIHTKVFREAKGDGWLDALIFFGVRDLRAQAVWAYGEHCESEWETKRPGMYPSFKKWWETARQYQFCEKATLSDHVKTGHT